MLVIEKTREERRAENTRIGELCGVILDAVRQRAGQAAAAGTSLCPECGDRVSRCGGEHAES